MVNPAVVQYAVERLIETYQFGSLADFMDYVDDSGGVAPQPGQPAPGGQPPMPGQPPAAAGGQPPIDPQQLVEAVKVGILEVMQDLQGGGQQQPPAQGQGGING